MRKFLPAVLLTGISLAAAAPAGAQDTTRAAPEPAATGANVEISVGTAVVERALQGAAESFPAATGTVYAFSRVTGVSAGSQIEHVWYHGDMEMARVRLNIGGSPWRTWSSKRLGENPSGEWRVDVVQDGQVIGSARFTVQ